MVTAAFRDPVLSAQAVFRGVLDATARPGTIVRLAEALEPPAPLATGAAAVLLALCDNDTPVWLDGALVSSPDVSDWIRFHTGAPLTDVPSDAAFAFVSEPRSLPPFDQFNLGSLDYPDRSTTLVLHVESFRVGRALTLKGPGIAGERQVRVASLPDDMPDRLAANLALFPRGVDLLLVTETELMALPRSTQVSAG